MHYSPLIERMRFFHEPDISWNRYLHDACFLEDGILSEMGAFLRNRMEGGLFVDVPCGAKNTEIPTIAAALGATELWEADADEEVLRERPTNNGERTEHGVHIRTFQDDILNFIASVFADAHSAPRAFYISGLQPDAEFVKDMVNQTETAAPYLNALYDELARVCGANDTVILNDSHTLVSGMDEQSFPALHPAIALPQRGFRLARRCAYDKVQVYVR